MKAPSQPHSGWRCTAAAAMLIAIVVGSRSAFGLFLSPINTATGLGLAVLGFAVALGQLGQGLAQPLVGLLADRYGATRLIIAGSLGFAAATVSLTWSTSAFAIAATVVLVGIAGTAMSSIAMLLGEVARRVSPARQALAISIVSAAGPAGQLLFGPMTQAAIEWAGWVRAVWLTAGLGLLALPLALAFRRTVSAKPLPPGQSGGDTGRSPSGEDAQPCGTSGGKAAAVRAALREPMFWKIGGGFAVCGFHMSFLSMHMPGVIERCGLPSSLAGAWLAVLGVSNIGGSLLIGLLLKRFPAATLLIGLHGLRALFVACLLAAPATPAVMLAFAAAMGVTFTAALPPTTVLVTRTFGPRRVATLFGVVMFLHQTGSFAGVWLGGMAAEATAGFRTIWLLDIGLALLAAVIYLPACRRRETRRLAALSAARGA